jgi:hypothetical protein
VPQDYPAGRGTTTAGMIAQIASTLFMPRIAGGLDLGDLGMRAHGVDPYLARKRKAIDATFDERVARAREHQREELARTPELLRKHLEKIWALPLSSDERRAALQALWDDCDESDSPQGQACALAHATLRGWIAAHPLDD